MKMISVCLMATNYVKYFVATSPILFVIFGFLVYLKMFLTSLTDLALAAINIFQDHPSINNTKVKNFRSVFVLTHTN